MRNCWRVPGPGDANLLEETNPSGLAQADYIYLEGRPIAVLNGSTLYYLHDDMLGTPQLATDSNQAVQWQASYDSFGQASTSGTITQNLRFPGQYFDVESGWNHNGFRDYAPQLGRYIEPDPLGRLGSGNNLYVYVGNNPANLIDPLGLCPNKACNVQPATSFMKAHAANAATLAKELNVPTNYVLAVAGDESAYGTSNIAIGANNYFGLHAGAPGSIGPWSGNPIVAVFAPSGGFMASGQSFVQMASPLLDGLSGPIVSVRPFPSSGDDC